MINSFREAHYFLSNMYPCVIEWEGQIYPASENAYQASKTLEPEIRAEIAALAPKASKRFAKQFGRSIDYRPDWSDDLKLKMMATVLRIKFTHPTRKEMLLATGDRELVEGNWWGDRFWGVYEGSGQNHLGKLLMALREELKTK